MAIVIFAERVFVLVTGVWTREPALRAVHRFVMCCHRWSCTMVFVASLHFTRTRAHSRHDTHKHATHGQKMMSTQDLAAGLSGTAENHYFH